MNKIKGIILYFSTVCLILTVPFFTLSGKLRNINYLEIKIRELENEIRENALSQSISKIDELAIAQDIANLEREIVALKNESYSTLSQTFVLILLLTLSLIFIKNSKFIDSLSSLSRKINDRIELIFEDGLNLMAFSFSYEATKNDIGEENFRVDNIENKGDGVIAVQLQVPSNSNLDMIRKKFKRNYIFADSLFKSQGQDELFRKEEHITHLNQILDLSQQHAQTLAEIARLQASRVINVEARALATSQSESNTFENNLHGARISNFANQVSDSAQQQTNQYNYASQEKQTLAEAAEEIQRLLNQLEATNPTVTETEQVAYVNVAARPDLKKRVTAALKAGGDIAIDEFFLGNKYLKVGKAIIQGWLQASKQ
jgi:hypothetical protein